MFLLAETILAPANPSHGNDRGISHRIIQHVLDEEAGMADDDALANLVAKRYHRYDDINKLKAYLARAGFRYDDINKAIERYHEQGSQVSKQDITLSSLD